MCVHRDRTEPYDRGDAYAQVALSTKVRSQNSILSHLVVSRCCDQGVGKCDCLNCPLRKCWLHNDLMQDVYKTAEDIRQAGGKITREPGPLPGLNTKILATTDPDGWKVVFVDEADFLAEL